MERMIKWMFGLMVALVGALALSGCGTPEPQTTVETVVVEGEDADVDTDVIEENRAEAEEPAAADESVGAPADEAEGFGGGGDDGAGGDVAAEEDAAPVPDVDDRAFQPSLSAGEIDDNADFSAYTSYVSTYKNLVGLGLIPDVNITERHVIAVSTPQGYPVLGAQVLIYADQDLITSLRTPASGTVYFHPLAFDQRADTYSVTVSKGQLSQGFQLDRSETNLWPITLGADPAQAPVQLDVLFIVDATGSMSEEIAQLKDNILSISAQIEALPANPDVRFGLVIYRDRGDEYVTRTFDFTDDVQAFQSVLNNVQAAGGGDTPESVNEALYEGVNNVEWRVGNTVSLAFLVADAPPHLDYEQDYSYAVEMKNAAEKGISIFPIASGGLDQQGEFIFRQIAQYTGGHFIFLTYDEEAQSSGEPGRDDVSVAEGSFTVEDLDVLVVRLIDEEIAQLFDNP